MKKHNFNAGPSILPQYTIDKCIEAIQNYEGTGLSVLEVSHRSKEFDATMAQAIDLFKELIEAPAGYQVIYVGGGASTQFLSVPYNLMEKKSAYLDTGSWAVAAIKEAKLFGEVSVVASSADKKYSYVPKDYVIPTDADYFHITSNNTIEGTEIRTDMDCPVQLVADMSSDIFSRPVDVSKYAVIYGGAQKNLAPAGVTFALIKEDILGKVSRPLPTMLDWRIHIKKGSMYNTPPVFAVYGALKTMEWIKAEGGVKVMEKRAIERANLLYGEIDRNKLFVSNVPEEDRSRMNICFVLKPEYAELEEEFTNFAKSKGMVGIKGHRSVGGFRASCYNALPVESVKALVDCMKEFEAAH